MCYFFLPHFSLSNHHVTIPILLDKFHTMTNTSSILCLNIQHNFHQATEWLEGLTRLVPNNKDELAEDQKIWVEVFSKAMVSPS